MPKHEVTSPQEAVATVTSLLSKAKETTPLAPVFFVTDNYRQGGQLVTQYISEYLAAKCLSSVVGVSQVTVWGLVERFCEILDISWSNQKFEDAVSKTVNTKLYAGHSFLDPTTLIPSTVSQIQKLVLSYQWVDFEDENLIKTVMNSEASATSKKLFEFSKSVLSELAGKSIYSPVTIINFCKEPKNLAALTASLSDDYFVVLSQNCPSSFTGLLQSIVPAGHLNVLNLTSEVDLQNIDRTNLGVTSFPDVITEVRAAVARTVEYLLECGKPDDVAILYADSADYAKHLRFALNDSGIAWYGTDPDSLSTTKMAALTLDTLALASDSNSKSLDRKFILRVIRSGLLRRQDSFADNLSWMSVERLIRERGLFNQAENWMPQLQKLSESQDELEKELAEYQDSPTDYEDTVKELNRALNDARAASALLRLIRTFKAFIDGISSAKDDLSEQVVMISLISLLSDLVGAPAKRKLADSEKACFEALDLFTQQANSSVATVKASVIPFVYSKLQQIFSAGTTQKKGSGVYVGELAQHPLKEIKYQILLGVSEGAFPKRRQEDPLCPDTLREALGSDYVEVLPLTSEQSKSEVRAVLSVLSSAKSGSISYSRSGLVGQGSGNLSASLEKLGLQEECVYSFEKQVDSAPNATMSLDILRKTRLSSMTGLFEDRDTFPGLNSMVALASDEFGAFSGELGPGLRTFDFTKSLSASAIETYLKCPHKFFVTRILGFKFEDDDDEVETLRALDFGTLVHKSFELLHHFCVDNQMLPDFGDPYSEESINQFKRIFNEQCDEVIQRGQAGWMPLFEQKRRNFLSLTDLYFKLEHEFRSIAPKAKSNSPEYPLRSDLALRPHLAEFSFDSKGILPLEIEVTSSSGILSTLFFKGQMDRVDKSGPDLHAGVVDFKTSQAKSLVASKNELVQDLLYSYALRKNSADFSNVQFVSFVYLTLNNPKESKIVRLRDADKNLYIDEANGGYSNKELAAKILEANQAQDSQLMAILRRFVDANEAGLFPPFAESKSAGYCEVCAKSFGKIHAKSIYKKVPKQMHVSQEKVN
jgi:RecB family exonuclease